jgi:transcription-repair coupling factor (superfamily II helicase)
VKVKMDAGPVVIASYSGGARERLMGLIEDEGVAEAIPVTDFSRVGKRGVIWRSGPWSMGSRLRG